MKNQCWLVNARAGRQEGARLIATLQGCVTVLAIDFERLSQQLELAAGYDRIVVAGGDGTFSAVLTSPALPERPIALIPLGTANDLARELGTLEAMRHCSWRDLPDVIDTFQEHRHACWAFESDGVVHPFCNYISLGFEGAVVSDFDRWRSRTNLHSRIVNRLMYFWFGLRHWFIRVRGVEVRIDSGASVFIRPSRGIIFSNIQSHMGCGIVAQGVDGSDDVLECVVASSPWDYLRMILSPWSVLSALASTCRSSSMHVCGIREGTPIQVDGEARPALNAPTAHIRLLRFVRVLAP